LDKFAAEIVVTLANPVLKSEDLSCDVKILEGSCSSGSAR